MISVDNKRIAKNSFMMSLRMLVILFVTLYTSRIVIAELGVQDYGIYNIVASVIVLFFFLGNSLQSATQRYLSYYIAKESFAEIKKVFCSCVNVYILIILLSVFIAETFGLWLLNYKLSIPENRIEAANIVYQLSILTFVLSLIRLPYNAIIIAYERMSFYAYLSILEAILKLLIAFLLSLVLLDKLVFYTFLLLISTAIITLAFLIYSVYSFRVARYNIFFEKKMMKEIVSFSGWNLLGSTSSVITEQGFGVLLNSFYGVVLNAALGVGTQISNAVRNFISGFQLAFNPQIVKLYALNNNDELLKLLYRSSKFSFIFVVLLSTPLMLNINAILLLWLDMVPNYSNIFAVLLVLTIWFDALSAPFYTAMQATGEIKKYQIYISFSFLLDFFLSYLAFSFSFSLAYILVIRVFTRGLFNMIIGLLFLKHKIGFSIKDYLYKVGIVAISVVIIPVGFIFIVRNLYYTNNEIYYIFKCVIDVFMYYVFTLLYVWFILLDKSEKDFILKSCKLKK